MYAHTCMRSSSRRCVCARACAAGPRARACACLSQPGEEEGITVCRRVVLQGSLQQAHLHCIALHCIATRCNLPCRVATAESPWNRSNKVTLARRAAQHRTAQRGRTAAHTAAPRRGCGLRSRYMCVYVCACVVCVCVCACVCVCVCVCVYMRRCGGSVHAGASATCAVTVVASSSSG